MRVSLNRTACAVAALLALSGTVAGTGARAEEMHIGFPVFLSTAAAGAFGEPEKRAAELLVEELNAGRVPAPYATAGINGRTLKATFIDEAADAVSEYRNLVERTGVDAVIGYTSSANCKAVAELAEELETPTVLVDCGTPQIFEELVTEPVYLFRTGPTGTMDSVGAARYLKDIGVDLAKVAGINQNYAFGQDAWRDFTGAIKALDPKAAVVSEQFPKVYAGQYGAEVSALMTASPSAVFTSFWGGDLEAFILQSAPRGLFSRAPVLMTCGEAAIGRLAKDIPEGAILGARGPYGYFAPESELAAWFNAAYEKKFGEVPPYPAWKMAQAVLGLKAAWEKAGEGADKEAAVAAFKGLEFDSPAGPVKMAIGAGHQAIQSISYGKFGRDAAGKPGVTDVVTYAAECVNPPADMLAADWIEKGFPGAQCD